MTTKTPGKSPQGQPATGPSQQELQAALQVHTLAQMLYGQMAGAYPWMQVRQPMPPQPMTMPPAPPMTAQGPQTFDPTMGPTMPWTQPYGASWCGPMCSMAPTCFPWYGHGFSGPEFPR